MDSGVALSNILFSSDRWLFCCRRAFADYRSPLRLRNEQAPENESYEKAAPFDYCLGED